MDVRRWCLQDCRLNDVRKYCYFLHLAQADDARAQARVQRLSALIQTLRTASASMMATETVKSGLARVAEQLRTSVDATISASARAADAASALAAVQAAAAQNKAARDNLASAIAADRDLAASGAAAAAEAVTAERERRAKGLGDPILAMAKSTAEAAVAKYKMLCSAAGGWSIAALTPSTVTLRYAHPPALALTGVATAAHVSDVAMDRTTRRILSASYSPETGSAEASAAGAFGATAYYVAMAKGVTMGLVPAAASPESSMSQKPHALLHAARNLRGAAEVCEGVRLARAAAGGIGLRIVEHGGSGGWAIAIDMSHGLAHAPSATESHGGSFGGLKLRVLLTLPTAVPAPQPWSAQVSVRSVMKFDIFSYYPAPC